MTPPGGYNWLEISPYSAKDGDSAGCTIHLSQEQMEEEETTKTIFLRFYRIPQQLHLVKALD